MQQSARSHAKVTTPVRNVQNDPCRVAMAAWHLPWPCSEAWPPVAELRDAPTSGGTGEPKLQTCTIGSPRPGSSLPLSTMPGRRRWMHTYGWK